MTLSITPVARDGAAVLKVVGELDMDSAPTLEAELGPLVEATDVVLDLSELAYVDSSGISALIVAHRKAEEWGHRLTLQAPSERVLRVLEICDLVEYLNVEN